jgi:hypothetical protein
VPCTDREVFKPAWNKWQRKQVIRASRLKGKVGNLSWGWQPKLGKRL